MSASAPAAPARPLRGLGRSARLVLRSAGYELRKATAYRTGFVVREVLRGTARPAVMVFVYASILSGGAVATVGGWSFRELVAYLILVATFDKLIFHQRALDLSEQIFEGHVTKFLVMPLRFFLLPMGRFVQYIAVQLGVAAAFWSAGALLLPQWWPLPPSAAVALQSLSLVLLGSACFFLMYFILHALAFWLDVVWTLLVMAGFATTFMAGALIPVAIMPPALRGVLVWLFPYWSLSAPIELFLGRLGTQDWLRGLAVLGASLLALELLRRAVWARGTRRYTGSGM